MFFVHISSSTSKYVKQQHLIKIILSLVALNKGTIYFRLSVNLSFNYEIVFHDSQQSFLNGSYAIAYVFHSGFVFELPLKQ